MAQTAIRRCYAWRVWIRQSSGLDIRPLGRAALANKKPDISGYTHFAGSGVYAADGGTSAATPVVAGVVAAVRSKRPYNPADSTTSPAAIRSLVTSTAEDLGASGYDYKHGHGVVDGCELGRKLCGFWWFDICKIHPWICKGVFRWPELPGPGPVIRWFDIPDIPFKIPRIIRFGRPSPGSGRRRDHRQDDRRVGAAVWRNRSCSTGLHCRGDARSTDEADTTY